MSANIKTCKYDLQICYTHAAASGLMSKSFFLYDATQRYIQILPSGNIVASDLKQYGFCPRIWHLLNLSRLVTYSTQQKTDSSMVYI